MDWESCENSSRRQLYLFGMLQYKPFDEARTLVQVYIQRQTEIIESSSKVLRKFQGITAGRLVMLQYERISHDYLLKRTGMIY